MQKQLARSRCFFVRIHLAESDTLKVPLLAFLFCVVYVAMAKHEVMIWLPYDDIFLTGQQWLVV